MKHQLCNPYKADDGYTWMVYCQRCEMESKVTAQFGNEECLWEPVNKPLDKEPEQI